MGLPLLGMSNPRKSQRYSGLPKPLRTTFERLLSRSKSGTQMRRFGLLINALEVLIKHVAVKALYLAHPKNEFSDEHRRWLQRPALGHYVAILRTCLTQATSTSAEGKLVEAAEAWKVHDLEEVVGQAVKSRNENWGHAAIREDEEYEELNTELDGYLRVILEAFAPLLVDAKDDLSLEPLVLHSTCGRCFYFNAASDRGIEYLCYADGSRRIEPIGSHSERLFNQLFPRPLDSKERPANWWKETLSAKAQHYQARTHPEALINEWLLGGGASCQIVEGDPGYGKTCLLAHFAKEQAACYHFFDERSAHTLDLGECFLNLAVQLAEKFGIVFEPGKDGAPKARASEFREILNSAAASISTPLLVVIDGLDDEWRSHSSKDKKLPKAFQHYLGSLANTPPSVRWLFSTRPETARHDILRGIVDSVPTETIVLGPFSDAETSQFLLNNCPGIDAIPRLMEQVGEASQGSPLYLALFAADFQQSTAPIAADFSLPKGLAEYYERVIQTMVRRSMEKQQASAFDVIGRLLALAHAEANLPAQEFLNAAKVKFGSSDPLPDPLLLICLYAVAYEALTPSLSCEVLDWPQSRFDLAFAETRPVLAISGQGHTIHHNALRDVIYRSHLKGVRMVRERIALWGAEPISERQYAVRWSLRHMCDAIEDCDPAELPKWETRITRIVTSLDHISLRAKAGLYTQLLRDCERFFDLRPSHGGECPLPAETEGSAEWLTESTEAVVSGHDAHLDQGTGPALCSLRKLGRLDPPPRSVSQHDDLTPDNSPPITIRSDVLEFAEFIRSSGPDLSRECFDIAQLARNFCADGPVAEAGWKQSLALGRIILANPAQWSSRRTIRRHEKPFQWVSHELREGWRWDLAEPDDEDDYETTKAIVVVSRFDLWSERQIESWSIKLPFQPGPDVAFFVSFDHTRVLLGNTVLHLDSRSVICELPLSPASEFAVSEDLRVGIAMDDQGFDPCIHLIDLLSGRLLIPGGIRPKETRSIAISRDGRLAAYGAYHGIELIDVVQRRELPIVLPSQYKASGVRFSDSGHHIAWKETLWNGDGTELRVMEIATRKLVVTGAFDPVPEPQAISSSSSVVLTSLGEVIDTRRKLTIDSLGYSPRNASRFARSGDYFHTGDELRFASSHSKQSSNRARPPLVMLGEKNGCLMSDENGAVSLRKFGTNNLLFEFRRSPDDKHFVSDWSGDRLEDGRLGNITVTNPCGVALLGYDDGLLYSANLTRGGLQRVNTPESIRQLIGKEYRRFVENSQRLKVSKAVVRRKQGPRYAVSKTTVSPDAGYAATVCEGEKVRVWSVDTGECMATLDIPFGKSLTEGEVTDICFSSDSKSLVILRADHQLLVWRFLHSRQATVQPLPEGTRFLSLSANSLAEHEGEIFISDGRNVLSWRSGKYERAQILPEYAFHVRINPRTRRLLLSDEEDRSTVITVRDLDSFELVGRHVIRSEGVEVSNLADDNTFAAITNNRGVEYYTIE
ncbi:MAG: NACHT domain-containing protein [Verrucomicrobiaceae bacterium]|nr:NACHT domain-containing protein [Verrucomicrobiaceae bacterium]